MDSAQVANITRALCEIHNRLGEIAMLLQMLVVAPSGSVALMDDDVVQKILNNSCTLTFNGENFRTQPITINKTKG